VGVVNGIFGRLGGDGLKDVSILLGEGAQAFARFMRGVMDDYFKPALIMISVITALLLFLRLPIFFISDVEITGNSRLTEEYILETMNIRSGETVYFWNAPAARGRLLENNYVDRVDIDINYTSRRVTIKIRERILSGYIEYVDGIFLYIDERGRVLESATSFNERLPVVVGLEFTQFTVGEVLQVNNPLSFDLVVTLAQLLNRYHMSQDIVRIDVSKSDDIHLFIGNIDVEFGDISDAEEKIRTIQAIMDGYLNDLNKSGFLNIRDISKPPRFRPLH
jgi:cell division septal protein FtsQ